MKLHIKSLPWPVGIFHVKLSNYLLLRVAHRLTENVPAPFPEHELLRTIADSIESGESIEIYDDAPPAPDLVSDVSTGTTIPVEVKTAWQRVLDYFA